jgi:polyhydroxybutyrate depolymerase
MFDAEVPDARVSRRPCVAGRLVVVAFALLAACSLPPRPPDGLVPAGDFTVHLRHDGRSRRYLVHVPPGAVTPRPVVLVLHGAAGDAVENRTWLGLDAVADREGFVTVYPDGTGPFGDRVHMWNSGACCGSAQWSAVDDVGFLLAVLDDVGARTPVDATRVYVTGLSNGGMMAYRLAAEASDRIAAIAPVAGTREAALGDGVRAMPVMHVHSVDDPVVPFAGGETTIFPLVYSIPHPAVEEVVREWALHDRCPVSPADTTPTLSSIANGQSATRSTWGPCADGAEVVLWRLRGSGHVWPGSPSSFRTLFIGPATSVIDVREEMWSFFRRFTRPQAATAGVRALATDGRPSGTT